MNQNDSLKWYQDHTAEFIARTADVDMTPHYSRFLEHVVPGGRILDLGCGAGKASLYFTQKGYQVLAVDGCQELCDFTHSWIIQMLLTRSGPALPCCTYARPTCPTSFAGFTAP